MTSKVLLPPAQSGSKRFHHPTAADPARPVCGSDALATVEWRTVPPEHPALTFRSECQQCVRCLPGGSDVE